MLSSQRGATGETLVWVTVPSPCLVKFLEAFRGNVRLLVGADRHPSGGYHLSCGLDGPNDVTHDAPRYDGEGFDGHVRRMR